VPLHGLLQQAGLHDRHWPGLLLRDQRRQRVNDRRRTSLHIDRCDVNRGRPFRQRDRQGRHQPVTRFGHEGRIHQKNPDFILTRRKCCYKLLFVFFYFFISLKNLLLVF
jgi:hypothetical protein